jgi:hypothetical protein
VRRREHRPEHHDQIPATHNERRRGLRHGHHDQVPRAAGIGLGTAIIYLRRTASGAASDCLGTTANYLPGAASIGLGTTIKYLRRPTSAAAGNGLGTSVKYLVNQNAGAGNNWGKGHYTRAGHEFY